MSELEQSYRIESAFAKGNNVDFDALKLLQDGESRPYPRLLSNPIVDSALSLGAGGLVGVASGLLQVRADHQLFKGFMNSTNAMNQIGNYLKTVEITPRTEGIQQNFYTFRLSPRDLPNAPANMSDRIAKSPAAQLWHYATDQRRKDLETFFKTGESGSFVRTHPLYDRTTAILESPHTAAIRPTMLRNIAKGVAVAGVAMAADYVAGLAAKSIFDQNTALGRNVVAAVEPNLVGTVLTTGAFLAGRRFGIGTAVACGVGTWVASKGLNYIWNTTSAAVNRR